MRCVASMKSRSGGCFVEGHILCGREQSINIDFCSYNRCRTVNLNRTIDLQLLITATHIYIRIHTHCHTTAYFLKPLTPLHTNSPYFIHSSDKRHPQLARWASLHHPLPARYIITQLSPPSLGIPDPSSGVAKRTLRSASPTFSSAAIGSGN